MKHILVATIFLLYALPALASNVALVIGNSSYTTVERLENPLNDANDIAEALHGQGFEVVEAVDLTYAQMRRTLREFRSLADRAEIALVYYAGHGIEVNGNNYMVPIDARLEDERDATVELINIDIALQQISGAGKMKMLVLDACRNNPFASRMKRNSASRSIVSRGLAEFKGTDADTMIAYAAAAGAVTQDGPAGGNSPFTGAFLSALKSPPSDVRKMLGVVRDEMRSSAPGSAPFVYNSLGGADYVINPKSGLGEERGLKIVTTDSGTDDEDTQMFADFGRAQLKNNVLGWRSFLAKYEGRNEHPLYLMAIGKLSVAGGFDLSPKNLERDGGKSAAAASGSLVLDNKVARTATPAVDGREDELSSGTNSVAKSLTDKPAPTVEYAQLAKELQSMLSSRNCYLGVIDGLIGRGTRGAMSDFLSIAAIEANFSSKMTAEEVQEAIETLAENPQVSCPPKEPAISPSQSVRKRTAKPAQVSRECVLFQGKKRCY